MIDVRGKEKDWHALMECHVSLGGWLDFMVYYSHFWLFWPKVKYLQNSLKFPHSFFTIAGPLKLQKEENSINFQASTWCKSPKNISLHPFYSIQSFLLVIVSALVKFFGRAKVSYYFLSLVFLVSDAQTSSYT